MEYWHLVERLQRKLAPLPGDPERVLETLLDALSDTLTPQAAAALGRCLPARAAARLKGTLEDGHVTLATFHAAVARALGGEPSQARELLSLSCRTLSESLDAEARGALMRELPHPIAELFSLEATPGVRPEHPGTANTLAAGRAGSRHPLSESSATSTHPVSSAQPVETPPGTLGDPNPHGDRKLSSGG